MSVEILKNISIAAYALGTILFVAAIMVFIKFDIKEIFGELTGITERKAVEDIRNKVSAETTGQKPVFYSWGQATAKTGRGKSKKLSGLGELLPKTVRLGETAILDKTTTSDETVMLDEATMPDEEEMGITVVLDAKKVPAKRTVIVETLADIRICDTENIIE